MTNRRQLTIGHYRWELNKMEWLHVCYERDCVTCYQTPIGLSWRIVVGDSYEFFQLEDGWQKTTLILTLSTLAKPEDDCAACCMPLIWWLKADPRFGKGLLYDCSLNFTDISGMTKTTLLSNHTHIGLSWRLAVIGSYEVLQWMSAKGSFSLVDAH
jgi:hypothetical protein